MVTQPRPEAGRSGRGPGLLGRRATGQVSRELHGALRLAPDLVAEHVDETAIVRPRRALWRRPVGGRVDARGEEDPSDATVRRSAGQAATVGTTAARIGKGVTPGLTPATVSRERGHRVRPRRHDDVERSGRRPATAGSNACRRCRDGPPRACGGHARSRTAPSSVHVETDRRATRAHGWSAREPSAAGERSAGPSATSGARSAPSVASAAPDTGRRRMPAPSCRRSGSRRRPRQVGERPGASARSARPSRSDQPEARRSSGCREERDQRVRDQRGETERRPAAVTGRRVGEPQRADLERAGAIVRAAGRAPHAVAGSGRTRCRRPEVRPQVRSSRGPPWRPP